MSVGLVVVSHSAQLAAGVVELVRQMTQGKTALAAAGGGPDDILGTSADKILEAIQQVEGPDGTLILLDLGSAILSAEMALEMRDDISNPITLTYAPLVEGCIAAALEASLGHSLQQVKQAAEQTASAQQLKLLKPLSETEEIEEAEEDRPTAATPAPLNGSNEEGLKTQLILNTLAGLHARPASLFVQTAARFQAQVKVEAKNKNANATSIMEVLGLSARQGDTLTILARGEEAQSALDALTELVKANFYEDVKGSKAPDIAKTVPQDTTSPSLPQTIPQLPHEPWRGISTSVGAALGPAFLYTGSTFSLPAVPIQTIDKNQVIQEQERLRSVLNAAAQELNTLAQEVRESVGQDEGGIFEAQALMLQDPKLIEATFTLISQQYLSAASALAQAGEQQARTLEQLDNALLAMRAVDVRDAVGRALRRLGIQAEQPQDLSALDQPVILLANDLTPSDSAQLKPEFILGICTVQGGPTAHSAIIARAIGIPAISGLNAAALQAIHQGEELGLDADRGLLYHQPDPEIREELSQRITTQHNERAQRQQSAQQALGPLSVQGRHIQLLANIGSESEANNAREWGAEGIGLLRTEFLFGGSATLPSEEEQFQRYQKVFRAFIGDNSPVGRPIVVRTLDAGADKPFPALAAAIGLQKEPNPALGLRGLRIHLAHEELLEIQIRALLRAADVTGIELQIMFPMVTTVEELHSARAIFDRVYKKLQDQITLPAHIPVGIMVEVPAAALMARELATLADFFSIGANDLMQYTLACDRTNSTVAYIYNPMQPALLRFIQMIASAGRQAGKPVSVCGEIANDVRIAPILVGLGVDELSMTPTALAAVREVLSKSTPERLQKLVQSVLQASTISEVEHASDEFLATEAR